MNKINPHRLKKFILSASEASACRARADDAFGGKKVSGSDATLGDHGGTLSASGRTIHEGHDRACAAGVRFGRVFSAVRGNNPELLFARERGIPTYSYPEMLGRIKKEENESLYLDRTEKLQPPQCLPKYLFVQKEIPRLL